MSSQVTKEGLLIPKQVYLYSQEMLYLIYGQGPDPHGKSFSHLYLYTPHLGSAMSCGLFGDREDMMCYQGVVHEPVSVWELHVTGSQWGEYRNWVYTFRLIYSNLLRHPRTVSGLYTLYDFAVFCISFLLYFYIRFQSVMTKKYRLFFKKPKHWSLTTVCANTAQLKFSNQHWNCEHLEFSLCHFKENLTLYSFIHQTSLYFLVWQVQTKMSSGRMQVPDGAWVHARHPQCFNSSQEGPHRTVPIQTRNLATEPIRKTASETAISTHCCLTTLPDTWLLAKKILTGTESCYWSSIPLKVQAPKYT